MVPQAGFWRALCYRQCSRVFGLLILAFTLGQFGALPAAQAHFTGDSFEARKAAYLQDQGRRWEADFPPAMIKGLFAWLEAEEVGLEPYSWNGRSRAELISQEIDYLTREDDCKTREGTRSFWWPWRNCWWTGDHTSPIVAGRVLYQYGHLLSQTDQAKIRGRLREVARSPGIWCANYNYHVVYIVTGYLYTHLVEDLELVDYPNPDPEYGCPPAFSYNGSDYTGGNRYPAKEIYRDTLFRLIDEWQAGGTPEDLSTTYYEIPVLSMALLHDFAPDAEMRRRAKMHLDWLILNYAVGFSARHPGGGSGRTYTESHIAGKLWFPWPMFFSLDDHTIDLITEPHREPYTDHYVSSYRFPALLTGVVESINGPKRTQGDDYYRVIRGYVPAMGMTWWEKQLGALSHGYRYAYVTPDYNLGGAGMGTGWELNILGEDTPFKLFINTCEVPIPERGQCGTAGRGELITLAPYGYQHRNAIFVNGGGVLHVVMGENTWEARSSESGWDFYRYGKVALAAKVSPNGPCALEVATLGVDYPSYDSFKAAVLAGASLSREGFTTSKGVKITPGYVDRGEDFDSLPFDRLEVWEGHVGQGDERKLVDWQGQVMTVSRDGSWCSYDFGRWRTQGDGCGVDSPVVGPFSDVPSDHWAHEDIDLLRREGYVAGCGLSPPRYCPEDPLSRAESAVLVNRGSHGADFTPPQPSESAFVDVDLADWFADWVTQLWEDGYTAGCGTQPPRFCPHAPHSRAEATVFFLRMLEGPDYLPPESERPRYLDVPVGEGAAWSANWIHAAHARGLVQGCEPPAERGDLWFRPEAPLTRAEAACMMTRAKGCGPSTASRRNSTRSRQRWTPRVGGWI
jgi:hypothetical protein